MAQLFSEAADHEQGVVDAQTQPKEGSQVQSEDRQIGDLALADHCRERHRNRGSRGEAR